MSKFFFGLAIFIGTAAFCEAQISITEYQIPTGGSQPAGITQGPDGNLWFTEYVGNKIGKITPSGVIAEFPIPTAASNPNGITRGPDGNLWFTERLGNKIGRITTAGVITEFLLPPGDVLVCAIDCGHSRPYEITSGPDGNLWFTESNASKIGRITPAGVITEFPTPTPVETAGIVSGPDGNLWFVEEIANQIGRITTAGVITEFPVPGPPAGLEIASGPDGNLWFTEENDLIGRITTAGVITEFPVPTSGSLLVGITTGPDGNLWFMEQNANQIGRITTAGVVTEYPVPTGGSLPEIITLGPDGNLWFTEGLGNNIGKATVITSPTITGLNATPNVLWPPNDKMVAVSVSGSTSGGFGTVSCQIISVNSNEPVDADGDWVITGDLSLNLRAKRLGNGTGRIYTASVQCTDALANSDTKTVTVSVPHDRGH